MSDEFNVINDAVRKLAGAQEKESEARASALQEALDGLRMVMAEFVAMSESKSEQEERENEDDEPDEVRTAMLRAIQKLADSIDGLRQPAPEVSVTPTINVPQSPAPVVNVDRAQVHNHVNVPEPRLHVMPAAAPPRPIRHEVEATKWGAGGIPLAWTITPIYKD